MKQIGTVLLLAVLLSLACGQIGKETTVVQPPAGAEMRTPTPTLTLDPVLLGEGKEVGLAPGLADRYASQSTSPDDDEIIAAVRSRHLFPIAGLVFDRVGSLDGPEDAPAGAPAYVLVDEGTGDVEVVAWYDREKSYAVEASTGYPLNVFHAPGVGVEAGLEGQEWYVYGFGWYGRWNRILPQPVIDLLEDFYSEGVEHVRSGLAGYQMVADADYFGGDLNLVRWDESLLSEMEAWGPDLAGAPFMALPDSGTVDIRDAHFQEALASALVVVDGADVDRYVASEYPKSSRYTTFQSVDAVINLLMSPFRNPGSYSDLQKAIILGVLYDDRGPLRIEIDFGMDGGFFVPDSGEKVFRVAPSEIDLMFGYRGIYFAKLPHELAHSVEFRDHNFLAEQCWQDEDEMVEPLKYVAEFMWWVQQYPGDAPFWDWEAINSGLILAHLLDGSFPNFRC